MDWFSGFLMERMLAANVPFGDMLGLALLLGSFSSMIVVIFSLTARSSHPRDSLPPQVIALFIIAPLLAISAGLMTVLLLLGSFVILNLMLFYLNHGFRWN